MRTLVLATVAATALASASIANATITLGSTGTISGTNAGVTAAITDNVNDPNKITFDTKNAVGTNTNFVDFIENIATTAVFSVTTATKPDSVVTLLNVFTGQTVGTIGADPATYGSTPLASSTGSSYSLNLITPLDANTWYRFVYTATMADGGGNISGTANFYARAVPEPATWAMMLVGFGGIGMAMRRRRRPALAQIA